MGTRYLAASWQGLVQYVVYLVSRGYYFYHITYFPLKKKDKFEEIDRKLIGKYKTYLSKFQRYRRKAKGLANFAYVRWHNIAIILHTPGEIEEGIVYDDQFHDIRERPLEIKVSDLTALVIRIIDGRVTVRLSRETYEGLRIVLYETAKTKDKQLMLNEFRKIDAFPSWAGIFEQKKNLARYLVKQARRNEVKMTLGEVHITRKRTPVQVFVEQDSTIPV